MNTESTGWENQPPGDQGIKDNNFYTIDQNNLPVYNNGMYYYNNYNQQNDINNGRYFSSSQLQSYVPQDNQYEYYQQQMQYVPQNEKYATPQMIQTPSASSNQTPQQMMSDRLDSVDEHQAMVAQYQSLNQNDNYYNQPTNPYQQKNAQLLQNFAAQQQSLQQLQSYPTSLQGGQSHSFPFSTTSEGPLQNQFAMNQPSVEYLDIDQNPNGDNIQENNPTKVFPITQMQYLPQSQTNHEQEFESMTSTSQSQLNLPSQNQQEISPQLLPSSVPSIQSESKTDKLFQDNKAETIVITDSNVTEENMTETVNNLPSQYAQGFQNQNMLPATSNSQSSEPLLPQKQQMSKLQLPTAQSLNRPMQSLSPQLPLISSSTSTPSLSQLFQQPYSQPQNKQELQNQFNMNTYQPTTTELLNVVQNPTTEGLNQPFVKLPTTSSQLPLQVPSTSSSEFQSSLLQSYPPPQNVQIIKFPTNNIKINQPPAGELLSMPDTAAVLNNKNGAFADNSQIDLENKLNNNPSNMMPFDVLQNENIDANTPQLDSINYTASPNNYDDTQKPFEGDGRNSETTLDQVQINPFEKNGMLSNNENENLNPNVHNDKMSSAADVEQIRPDVTYNNGYVNDAAMDLQNPSSNLVSCPLKKYYRRKNKISIPNNNNSGTSVAEMSSDNLLAQNTIAAISNALQVPMYGTKLIFDVTRSNFPNVPIIQQLSFMKSIVQSIVTGLRKAVNSIRNRMTVSLTSV